MFLIKKKGENNYGRVPMINRHIRSYLVTLGFANYYHHFIHGDPDRLHWCKKDDPYTIDATFNTRSGHIWIADDVKIGHGVMFLTGLHVFENGVMTNKVPESGRDIVVKSGCWIASRAIILGGVTIGENCKVYAGAVVADSFPAGSKIKGDKAR
jgi:acetyltransferase-like isoleucine patch superfamily enzyme